MTERETILWKRLDLPAYETALLAPHAHGWQLSGVAVLAEAGRPCRLEYEITCDSRWLTRRCVLTGYIGTAPVGLEIVRAPSGKWAIGGAPAPTLDGCDDIDLEFSPSTNLLPIRRVALDVGASAAVRAAWVRFPGLTVERFEQVYTRLGADRYRYESADGAFRRELTVDASGFVLEYPGLWRAEGRSGTGRR